MEPPLPVMEWMQGEVWSVCFMKQERPETHPEANNSFEYGLEQNKLESILKRKKKRS
jgi:hypothetical protein